MNIDVRILVPLVAIILTAISVAVAVYVWSTVWIFMIVATIVFPTLSATLLPSQDGVALGVTTLLLITLVLWNVLHWLFIIAVV